MHFTFSDSKSSAVNVCKICNRNLKVNLNHSMSSWVIVYIRIRAFVYIMTPIDRFFYEYQSANLNIVFRSPSYIFELSLSSLPTKFMPCFVVSVLFRKIGLTGLKSESKNPTQPATCFFSNFSESSILQELNWR